MRIKTVYQVDCFDLDELVTTTYGRSWSLLEAGRWGVGNDGEISQDTMINVSVPNKYDGEVDDMTVDQWLEQPEPEGPSWKRPYVQSPPLYMLMADLHAKGLIPEGEYAVRCWW